MEVSSESTLTRVEDLVVIPNIEVSLSNIEDSGYLSASQSCNQYSLLSDGSGDFSATPLHINTVPIIENAVTPYLVCEAANNTGDSFNCMDVDDPLTLSIIDPKPPTEISRCLSQPATTESPKVWQSTPAIEKQHVNLQREFDFVTPLPASVRTIFPAQSSGSSCFPPVCLAGQSHVDILSHLAEQNNFRPPLLKIFNYLDPVDLCQVRLVSHSWRQLLQNSPHLKTWQHFVRARHWNKENSKLTAGKPEEELSLLSPTTSRTQLREIHNVVRVITRRPARSPPVSPSKLHSSRYLKEGQKLRRGQKLLKCPKCEWPSRCETYSSPEAPGVSETNTVRGARCTRGMCQFYFCMDCSSPFHENSPCPKATPVTPTRPRSRHIKVGSKSSKRTLRRLLM